MISLIQVHILSNLKVYWCSKPELNIFIGVDWMYMSSVLQADIQYLHFRKTGGNRYWWKLYLFIDMICLVIVDWLLLQILNTYSILSTSNVFSYGRLNIFSCVTKIWFFSYLVTKKLFSDQFNEKRLAISLPLIM